VKLPLPPFDASLIDVAPVDPRDLPVHADEDEVYAAYSEVVGQLSEQLAAAEAEIERLKGQQTVEQVKAGLLAPYSARVFWFVVSYCVVVGAMLALAGWSEMTGFKLSDAILGIIAGSTAVSVIGLIGMVISGLFGVGKS
jgi:hypothetical protein